MGGSVIGGSTVSGTGDSDTGEWDCDGRTSSHLTVIFSGSQEEGWSEVVTTVETNHGQNCVSYTHCQLWTRIIAQHARYNWSYLSTKITLYSSIHKKLV